MNKIIVHLGEKSWNATYVGPHAERIIRLFDTATLPLPLTAAASPEQAINHMRVISAADVVIEHFR